ncbi:hypothetical protein [Actinoplanes flavus]|uniref:Uncharacterized protein n=1 Tax=Actinoplanes flavus TaxID=2820290 RepID=A0ABS3V004_9ACTN|nr:hypothetical protein [Actinoplanes flavus]MBO3744119.1 hypothetical protein [Actinoplanes flavus]
MVQATSPDRGSGQNGYRVGRSHDAPAPTASSYPADGGRLPPIVWSRVDRGRILREDLLGLGKSVVVAVVGIAAFIATGMGIALLVTTVLKAFGIDPGSYY